MLLFGIFFLHGILLKSLGREIQLEVDKRDFALLLVFFIFASYCAYNWYCITFFYFSYNKAHTLDLIFTPSFSCRMPEYYDELASSTLLIHIFHPKILTCGMFFRSLTTCHSYHTGYTLENIIKHLY